MVAIPTPSGNTYRPPAIRVSRFTSGLPKLVILYEHAVIPEILATMLADRAEIVGVTVSGRAAVAMSELYLPDVVVTEEMLIDGVAEYYLPALLQTGTRVVALTAGQDSNRLMELAGLGVTGIIDADQSPDDMADAVLVLAGGGAALPSDVMARIASEWRRSRRKERDGPLEAELTGRELEVLDAMSDGLSTKAVAHHLGIAIKTVENHKTRIFDKLGVKTQAQAVAMVLGGHVPSVREQDITRPSSA